LDTIKDLGEGVLTLQISLQLEDALRALARRKHISVEAAAMEALQVYVQEQSTAAEPEKNYSFIGIGHSSQMNLPDKLPVGGRVSV
jgi:hypothetical protein